MKRWLLVLLPLVLIGSVLASTGLYVAESRRRIALEHAMKSELALREASDSTKKSAEACATEAVNCCVAELPLSTEQKEKLTEACLGCCASLDAATESTETILKDLEVALADPAIDRAKIDALVTKLCDARTRELKARVESILLVRGVLAHEQIEKLREVLRKN